MEISIAKKDYVLFFIEIFKDMIWTISRTFN